MNKILTAKIQQLNSDLPQYCNSFSNNIIIEPEEKEVLLKKGKLYIIFELNGQGNFDTQLITKVVHDTMQENYYQSENISPIQSLEKAIIETRDKVGQLSTETITKETSETVFNLAALVLWGNVLYVTKYGDINTYVMREGIVNEMKTISEGNFSTSSGVVRNDDVIIVSTEEFSKEFPPQKLLTNSILEQQFKPNQTCLLMGLHVDTSFSENEVVDFGINQKPVNNRSKKKLSEFISKIKSIKPKKEEKPIQNEKVIKRSTKITEEPKTSIVKEKPQKSIKPLFIVLPVIAVLAAISIYFVIKPNSRNASQEEASPIVLEDSEDATPEEDRSRDEEFKIQRVSPNVFYDIKIDNPEVNPSDIIAFENYLVVTDKNTGKIYVSETDRAKFTENDLGQVNINSARNYEEKLHFYDAVNYKVLNLESLEIEKELPVVNAGITYPYAGFFYAISQDKLIKYTETEGTVSDSLWGQNSKFSNAKDMAIAFSIYVITADNELAKFAGGSETDFEINSVEFENATKIVAGIDFENIYILDKDLKSIVVIDSEGTLLKQYRNEDSSKWNDIRGFDVSPDEKTLYVINDSKIYAIEM